MTKRTYSRKGYLLLEFIPTLSVVIILLAITILALNPQKQFREARNEKRKHDIALIADAIVEFSRDHGQSLLISIPITPSAAMEICSDHATGSCAHLFSLKSLIGSYLHTIPIDPQSSDSDRFNEHSRYFIVRTSHNRFTITAPNTEPDTASDLSVSR